MKRIVIPIKPFTFLQSIYILENDECRETNYCSIDDLTIRIFGLIDEYNIQNIDLVGSKTFLEGIKKDIQEYELTKYGKNKIKINIT